MKLIDAETAKKVLCNAIDGLCEYSVDSLVECHECAFMRVKGDETKHCWCDFWEHSVDLDDFCSRARERNYEAD